MSTFITHRTDSTNIDFLRLIQSLDRYLSIINGEQDSFYKQFNNLETIQNVVVVYLDDIAVGCGAFKPYDANTVEIKRMFVDPTYRGKKVGTIMLDQLEAWAKELGYTQMVLETGKTMEPAIRLYEGYGFKLIPNYGQYVGKELSVCFGKEIL